MNGLAPHQVLSSHMVEDRLRPQLDVYLRKVEVGIYGALAALLLLTALATMVSAARML